MRNTLKPTLTILSRSSALLGVTALALSMAACGGSKWHEVAKSPTGDPVADQQKAPDANKQLHAGDPGFVSTDHLPARDSVRQEPEEAPASLEKNDKIEIIDPNPEGDDTSVQAVVVDTQQEDLKGKTVVVSKKFISHSPVLPSNEDNERDKYFMIQNIATEKVRVYRNCASKDAAGACVHKMVLETDMTAGEDTPDQSRRSLLGSYRLEKWFKFYEDHEHFFPSFYAPGYPNLPDAGASLTDWMSPKLLPKKGGVMRGSFGWYTAYLTPNANNQWTHGTFGWGKDGGKFISIVKDPANKIAMDVRSQGCTRVENQAIALMREILPAGTRIFKIYAKESYADATRARYKTSSLTKWDWILTKKNGDEAPKSAKKWAPASLVDHKDEILDHGTYVLDQMPDAAKGNVYNVKSMKGVFLVDEGRLVGYEHPKELKVGGIKPLALPSLVVAPVKN